MNPEQTPPRFKNPWAKCCVQLGAYDFLLNGEHLHRYDLYAVKERDDSVSFGARWSDDGPDYLSGEAWRDEQGLWRLAVHGPTAIAAARYFANHRPHYERLRAARED